jgi:hypothetical protein
MKLLSNIWQDLVEKRLVPVLVVLVVALVAVPVVLGRGGGADPVDAPLPVIADGTIAAKPAVSLDESKKIEKRAKNLLNPFQQQHVPKPQDAATTPSTGETTGGSGSSGSPGGSEKKKSTSEALSDDYKLTVKFGDPGATKTKTLYSLSPLPDSADPFVVFLGVQADGKTAVFLVSTDAKATGDGICQPSETDCQKVEMIKGDTELFDVADGTGSAVKQYELKLVSVKKR